MHTEHKSGFKTAPGSNMMKEMDWLLGSWINRSSNGHLYEIWRKNNDTLFSGESFLIEQNDTTFHEKISLEWKDGNLYYIPTVRDQNNGRPVLFKLISGVNGEYVFENKEHDFPHRIIYKNPAPDSLHARIEGIENGILHKEEFPMNRTSRPGL